MRSPIPGRLMEILGRTGGGGVGIQKQKHFKGSMKLIKIRIFRVVVEGGGAGSKTKEPVGGV